MRKKYTYPHYKKLVISIQSALISAFVVANFVFALFCSNAFAQEIEVWDYFSQTHELSSNYTLEIFNGGVYRFSRGEFIEN